jgi:hypothetical protein
MAAVPPGFTQLGSDSSKITGKAIVANTKPQSAKDLAFLAAAEKVRAAKSWEEWEPAVINSRDADPFEFVDFKGLPRNYRGDMLNKDYDYLGTAYRKKSGGRYNDIRIRRTPIPDDLKPQSKQLTQEEFNKIVAEDGYLRRSKPEKIPVKAKVAAGGGDEDDEDDE